MNLHYYISKAVVTSQARLLRLANVLAYVTPASMLPGQCT